MYTELLKKFEDFRENSHLFTDAETLKILDEFDEDQRRLEDPSRRATFI